RRSPADTHPRSGQKTGCAGVHSRTPTPSHSTERVSARGDVIPDQHTSRQPVLVSTRSVTPTRAIGTHPRSVSTGTRAARQSSSLAPSRAEYTSLRASVTFERNAFSSSLKSGPYFSPSAKSSDPVPRPTCTAATRSALGTVYLSALGSRPAVIVHASMAAGIP